MFATIYVRAAVTIAAVCVTIGEAAALSDFRAVRHAPEIDGPAGIAAIAVLAGTAMMAYHRLRK